jgi:hypothetical protein
VIVFDLKCAGGHVFEAWFGSSAAYEEQRAGGLVACPLCGASDVTKAVMAPNIGAKGNARSGSTAPVEASASEPSPEAIKGAIAAIAAVQAKMLEGSEWVGVAFTDRARAMHAGDEDPAPIHGQATLAQARELIEDGVAVAPLPLPVIPPAARN